jgi:hypothetical protein
MLARAPIVTLYSLMDVVAFFAPTMILGLGPPSPALEPKAPDTFFEPGSSSVTCIVAIEAIARGIVFLLSFMDFADVIS